MKHYILPLIFTAFVSCGTDNIFFSLEQRDVATEATIAIESNDPEKAIDLCLNELGSGYSDIIYDLEQGNIPMAIAQSQLLTELSEIAAEEKIDNPYNTASILSTAYAKKAGVDVIDIIAGLVEPSSSSSDSLETVADQITYDLAGRNLGAMESSVAVLRSIGLSNNRDVENFKLTFYQLSYMTLFVKSLPDVSDIDVTDALVILDFLEASLQSGSMTDDDNGENASMSVEIIQEIYDDIGVLPTDTDSEKETKVQSFLDGMNL